MSSWDIRREENWEAEEGEIKEATGSREGLKKKEERVKERKAHWSNTKRRRGERTSEVRVKLQISAP